MLIYLKAKDYIYRLYSHAWSSTHEWVLTYRHEPRIRMNFFSFTHWWANYRTTFYRVNISSSLLLQLVQSPCAHLYGFIARDYLLNFENVYPAVDGLRSDRSTLEFLLVCLRLEAFIVSLFACVTTYSSRRFAAAPKPTGAHSWWLVIDDTLDILVFSAILMPSIRIH